MYLNNYITFDVPLNQTKEHIYAMFGVSIFKSEIGRELGSFTLWTNPPNPNLKEWKKVQIS